MKRSVVYRLHDPLTRSNWGGRATSLAMGRILESGGSREISAAIGAPYITSQISDIDHKDPSRSAFTLVDELAKRIAEPPPGSSERLVELHDAIESADEMVVNGEGDFILRERLSLTRTLATMRAAKMMGKPVHLLNSILSHAPVQPAHLQLVMEQVGATLEACDSIVYRDPQSLALHQELYPRLPATWAPDALFSWAGYARTDLSRRDAFSPETEGLPVPVQRLLTGREPYVVLSGTSLYRLKAARFRRTVTALAQKLEQRGIATVFASTDDPDLELAAALNGTGIPCVDPRVPLTAAARLLWNAEAIVSGRYHPSILASLGGTPFVLMSSNSHKTRSLYEVVPFGRSAVEEPFFNGGETQAGRLAEIITEYAGAGALRRRVARVALKNGRQVVSAFTAAVNRTP